VVLRRDAVGDQALFLRFSHCGNERIRPLDHVPTGARAAEPHATSGLRASRGNPTTETARELPSV
jgi:hypothetical protein